MGGAWAIAAFALPGIVMPVADAFSTVEVSAARAPAAGSVAELQITTGQLPRGARLVVSTASGRVLGAVAPFPPGSATTRATVPVPAGEMAGRSLRLRLQIVGGGVAPRAPEAGEVGAMALIASGEE